MGLPLVVTVAVRGCLLAGAALTGYLLLSLWDGGALAGEAADDRPALGLPPVTEALSDAAGTVAGTVGDEEARGAPAEPAEDAAAEPAVDAAAEPVADAVVDPVADAVVEPAAEAVVEPLPDAVVEPVVDLIVEPVAESLDAPASGTVRAPAEVGDVRRPGDSSVDPRRAVAGAPPTDRPPPASAGERPPPDGPAVAAGWSGSAPTAAPVVAVGAADRAGGGDRDHHPPGWPPVPGGRQAAFVAGGDTGHPWPWVGMPPESPGAGPVEVVRGWSVPAAGAPAAVTGRPG